MSFFSSSLIRVDSSIPLALARTASRSCTFLDAPTTFYSYKNSAFFTPGSTFQPKELWLAPELMTGREAVQKLALPYATGYDTLLTVNLPAGTRIMTPRPVWSLFGRPGGGVETRVYAPVTNGMYQVGPVPVRCAVMAKIEIPAALRAKLGPEMKMDVHWADVKLHDGRVIKNLVVRGGLHHRTSRRHEWGR